MCPGSPRPGLSVRAATAPGSVQPPTHTHIYASIHTPYLKANMRASTYTHAQTCSHTHTCCPQYLRVFALLWRLKRVESALSGSWMVLQCEVERALAKFPNSQSGWWSGRDEEGRVGWREAWRNANPLTL